MGARLSAAKQAAEAKRQLFVELEKAEELKRRNFRKWENQREIVQNVYRDTSLKDNLEKDRLEKDNLKFEVLKTKVRRPLSFPFYMWLIRGTE